VKKNTDGTDRRMDRRTAGLTAIANIGSVIVVN
jgi:hypothetical protein